MGCSTFVVVERVEWMGTHKGERWGKFCELTSVSYMLCITFYSDLPRSSVPYLIPFKNNFFFLYFCNCDGLMMYILFLVVVLNFVLFELF